MFINCVYTWSTSGTLFVFFNKHVKTLQEKAAFHLFLECSDELLHKITEWRIKYGETKTTD